MDGGMCVGRRRVLLARVLLWGHPGHRRRYELQRHRPSAAAAAEATAALHLLLVAETSGGGASVKT